MAGWNQLDEVKEGSGIFASLKSGQTIEGVFRGEPHCFYQVFGEKNECSANTPKASFKFKINLIVKENGMWVPKIFQQGVTFGKLIRKYLQECGDNTLFKIEREGSTKDDTSYYIYPKGPVSPEDMAQIRAVKLHSLTSKKSSDDMDFPPPEEPRNY